MYQGTPYDVPSTTPVAQGPGKNSASSMRSVGVGSSEPVAANSPIHVVPIWAMSGVSPAAIAEANLSCAASTGIGVISMVTSGLSAMKSSASTPSDSPSAPKAHIDTVPVAGPSAIASASTGADASPPSLTRPHPAVATPSTNAPAANLIHRLLTADLLGRNTHSWSG